MVTDEFMLGDPDAGVAAKLCEKADFLMRDVLKVSRLFIKLLRYQCWSEGVSGFGDGPFDSSQEDDRISFLTSVYMGLGRLYDNDNCKNGDKKTISVGTLRRECEKHKDLFRRPVFGFVCSSDLMHLFEVWALDPRMYRIDVDEARILCGKDKNGEWRNMFGASYDAWRGVQAKQMDAEIVFHMVESLLKHYGTESEKGGDGRLLAFRARRNKVYAHNDVKTAIGRDRIEIDRTLHVGGLRWIDVAYFLDFAYKFCNFVLYSLSGTVVKRNDDFCDTCRTSFFLLYDIDKARVDGIDRSRLDDLLPVDIMDPEQDMIGKLLSYGASYADVVKYLFDLGLMSDFNNCCDVVDGRTAYGRMRPYNIHTNSSRSMNFGSYWPSSDALIVNSGKEDDFGREK